MTTRTRKSGTTRMMMASRRTNEGLCECAATTATFSASGDVVCCCEQGYEERKSKAFGSQQQQQQQQRQSRRMPWSCFQVVLVVVMIMMIMATKTTVAFVVVSAWSSPPIVARTFLQQQQRPMTLTATALEAKAKAENANARTVTVARKSCPEREVWPGASRRRLRKSTSSKSSRVFSSLTDDFELSSSTASALSSSSSSLAAEDTLVDPPQRRLPPFSSTTTASTLTTAEVQSGGVLYSEQGMQLADFSTLFPSTTKTAAAASLELLSSDSSSPDSVTTGITTMNPSSSSISVWYGRAIVLGAAAIYGTNFATVKMLDAVMPLGASAAIRFTLAAVAVVTAACISSSAASHKPSNNNNSNNNAIQQQQQENTLSLFGIVLPAFLTSPAVWLGLEVGAWYCIGYICQALGLQTVDAGKSAFINSLAVLVVPLLDWVWKRRSLQPKTIVSLCLAVTGTAILQFGSAAWFELASWLHPAAVTSTATAAAALSSGDVYALCQALFFGIGYWRLEAASHKYPTESVPMTAGQLVAVAVGSILYCMTPMGGGGLPDWNLLVQWLTTPMIVQALLWTGLVSTALALFLETVALQTVSATELTVMMTTVSLWGTAFAWMTLGEVPSAAGAVGGLLILAACVVSAVLPATTTVKVAATPVVVPLSTTTIMDEGIHNNLLVQQQEIKEPECVVQQ